MFRRGMVAVAVVLVGTVAGIAQAPPALPPLGAALPLQPVPVQPEAPPAQAQPGVLAVGKPYTPPAIDPAPITPVRYQPETPSPTLPAPTNGQPTTDNRQPTTDNAQLAIDAVGPATIAPGQPLAYEIIIRNTGTVVLGWVRVEDVLPPGGKLRSAEPQAEVQADHLVWNLGNLDPGVERRIKVEIQPGSAGEVTLTPSATFTLAKPWRTQIVQPPLAVTQTVAETAVRGGPVTFQIQIANHSTQWINGITLHDTLPPGLLRLQDYDKQTGATPVPSAQPPSHDIECDIASLAPGETRTVTLDARAAQTGRLINHVTARASGGLTADSQISVTVTETPVDLRVTAPKQATVGQPVDFLLEVSNPGTAAAANVCVRQALPDGVEFLAASTGGTFDAAERVVSWPVGTLAPGHTQALTLKLRGHAASDWVFKTTAAADGAQEAKAFQTLHLEGDTALRLEVTRHEDAIDLGAESIYEVRVHNGGTLAATGVRLSATVSPELLVINADGPAKAIPQPQQVVFEPLPQLDAHSDAVYRVRIKGQSAGNGGLTVQATTDQQPKPLVQQVSTTVQPPRGANMR